MAALFRLSFAAILVLIILIEISGCSNKTLIKASPFLSESYHHFEGGVLFTEIDLGLSVLWNASFKNGRPYKENLGLLVPGGLFILPNKNNTVRSSRFEVILTIQENKLYMESGGMILPVLAIIHTHPDFVAVSEPTPKMDYQYAYLGIHNYIISANHLYDAYHDSYGNDIFERYSPTRLTSTIINSHNQVLAGLGQQKIEAKNRMSFQLR